MPKRYPEEFCRKVLELVAAGRLVEAATASSSFAVASSPWVSSPPQTGSRYASTAN